MFDLDGESAEDAAHRSLTADQWVSCPMENRICFCKKMARTFLVQKADSEYLGRWCFGCGQDPQCGYFQPQGSPVLEECWCGGGRPSKMCQVQKEGPTKGLFFLTCGVRACSYFRYLPIQPQKNKDVQRPAKKTVAKKH
jgi:hypothetical protein